MSKFITSTKPKKYKIYIYKLVIIFSGWLARKYISTFFKNIEITGRHHLNGGPKLVLMNHSCPLDPLLIIFFGRKPLQFLVSESFMQNGIGGRLAALFGHITKRKLDHESSSIRLLKAWCDEGGSVALFPEGRFSWDGTPCPLMPGIDQLIKFLNVPVVTVNLINGDRVKPAWAKFYRKTSIKIVINPPIYFSKKDNILEEVKNKIFSLNSQKISYPSYGSNLISGMKKHLRFCPYCFADNSLVEHSNRLSCQTCLKFLEVDANNNVISEKFKSIKQLFDTIYSHLDSKYLLHHEISSIALVEVIDMTSTKYRTISNNFLTISNEVLKSGNWRLELNTIIAHTMDWGDLIIIKTKNARFGLKMRDDSRPVFTHYLNKVVPCT